VLFPEAPPDPGDRVWYRSIH